jgi:putative endonuclease
MTGGYLSILSNKRHGTLYVGVTSAPEQRIYEHRHGIKSDFAHRWGLTRVVHIQQFSTIEEAIAAEKRVKKWHRSWKIDLIERANPSGLDLMPAGE